MVLKFLLLVILQGVLVVVAWKEVGKGNLDHPATFEIDKNHQSLPKTHTSRSGRALWSPAKLLVPIFNRFINSLFKPSSRSSSTILDRSNNVDAEETPTSMAFLIPRLLQTFGFAHRRKDPRIEICKELGGVLLNGECQHYFGKIYRRSFEDARSFCQSKGGDLWTPDLRDPFLYQKLMKYMPEIAGANGEDLWLGAYQYNERVFTIHGEDITDAYLIQIYDKPFSEGHCFILDYPNGNFKAKDTSCTSKQEFICEFPVSVGNEIRK